MKHAFSIKESIVFGWHKVKAHSGLVFGVVITMFALQIASSIVEKGLRDTALGALASVALAVLGIVLGAGATLIFLKLAKGEHARYGNIIPPAQLIWKYFCASVLTGLISFLPLMAGALASLALLLSTGSINFSEGAPIAGHEWAFAVAAVIMAVAFCFTVYLAIRYLMARLAVLDGAEILGSLSKSAAMTHGAKGHLLLLMLAMLGLNILGLMALVVGLLVSIPVSALALAHVYLKLKAHHGRN